MELKSTLKSPNLPINSKSSQELLPNLPFEVSHGAKIVFRQIATHILVNDTALCTKVILIPPDIVSKLKT